MAQNHDAAQSKPVRRRGSIPIWIPLLGCTAVSILSTGLYTPSLPHLARLLATDETTIQLTMSLNLLTFALAQLAYGPLADRFGRKRLLLVGLACFTLASLGCALAGTFETLLAGRIAQGAFACVPSVVVAVIIRESYDETRSAKVLGLYGVALGGVPALGPVIGGYVFVFAGWRMNFFILAGIALLMLLFVAAVVPESGGRQRRARSSDGILVGYLRLLANRTYMAYLMPLAGIFGALYAFVTAAPFVLIDRLGIAAQHYGYAVMLPIAAFMLGSLVANRLAGRVSIRRQIQGAVLTSFCGGFLMFAVALAGYDSLAAILIGASLHHFGLGVLMATSYVGLLDAVSDDSRGSASALAGSAQVGVGALASFLVGAFHDGSALPMGATLASLCAVGALGWLILKPASRSTVARRAGRPAP